MVIEIPSSDTKQESFIRQIFKKGILLEDPIKPTTAPLRDRFNPHARDHGRRGAQQNDKHTLKCRHKVVC
jgi:hypothetical protein